MSFWITLRLVMSTNIKIFLILVHGLPKVVKKKFLRRRCDRYSSDEKLNDVQN